MKFVHYSAIFELAVSKLREDANPTGDLGHSYSCIAIDEALDELGVPWSRQIDITRYIRDAGCPVHSFMAFDEFPTGPVRQQARANWLTMLAEMARSEGRILRY